MDSGSSDPSYVTYVTLQDHCTVLWHSLNPMSPRSHLALRNAYKSHPFFQTYLIPVPAQPTSMTAFCWPAHVEMDVLLGRKQASPADVAAVRGSVVKPKYSLVPKTMVICKNDNGYSSCQDTQQSFQSPPLEDRHFKLKYFKNGQYLVNLNQLFQEIDSFIQNMTWSCTNTSRNISIIDQDGSCHILEPMIVVARRYPGDLSSVIRIALERLAKWPVAGGASVQSVSHNFGRGSLTMSISVTDTNTKTSNTQRPEAESNEYCPSTTYDYSPKPLPDQNIKPTKSTLKPAYSYEAQKRLNGGRTGSQSVSWNVFEKESLSPSTSLSELDSLFGAESHATSPQQHQQEQVVQDNKRSWQFDMGDDDDTDLSYCGECDLDDTDSWFD